MLALDWRWQVSFTYGFGPTSASERVLATKDDDGGGDNATDNDAATEAAITPAADRAKKYLGYRN